jgi:hypothetical protein
LSRALPNQQLIIGTVSLPGVPDNALPKGIRKINLSGKFGLLIDDEYEIVSDEIDKMHQLTLASA